MKRIEGGQEGIQYISKGSQQFATEGNFLFMTTNETKQSFHIKTGGGIIIENKKNKIHLQENSVKLDLLYLEENIEGDFSTIIGGNYWIKMTDKKGQIKITDFYKYQITGDTFEIDAAKFLIKRGDYGLDWENDLIISNPSQIKFMSLNGDINFSTKNGERIIFENEKPNGIIEFRGERSLIKTGIAKMEHRILQIICPDILINRKIKIEDDGLEVHMSSIQFIGEKIDIGCIKIREKELKLKTENIQFGAGEDNRIEITKDKICLIGEGDLGIMLTGRKGGIKMLGDLQWIHLEDVLIHTESDQKILRIGAESWKLRLEGIVEIENCTLIGENKKVSGEICEIFGNSSVSWHIQDKKGQINANGFLFESGLNKIEINSNWIKETGGKKNIEFGAIQEIGINKSQNWDTLDEKGLIKKSEWEVQESIGDKKKENWKKSEEDLIQKIINIREKYELTFGKNNGIYWNNQDADELEIRGILKKNDRHTIFLGDNKLIIENNEFEIRNCLRWRENELLLGVGKRINNIFLTEDIILLGSATYNLAFFEDKINLGECILVNSYKQVFIGDLLKNDDSKDKKIVIGLQQSSFLLDEKHIQIRGKKIYLSSAETIQLGGKITQINSESIGIGSNETEFIEFKGQKIIYKKKGSRLEIDDSFLFVKNGESGSLSRFSIGEKGVNIDSDDIKFEFGVHIKTPIMIHSIKDINIESTIGNIQIKNHESQIYMNHDENILGIWSEGNILINGKKLMMDGEKIEMNLKNIEMDSKTDIDIRFGRKLEVIGGKEIEFQSKEEIKLASDLFGEIRIGENSHMDIYKSFDMKIGDNLSFNIDGNMKWIVEKNIKIFGKGFMKIELEDGIDITTSADICLKSMNIMVKTSEIYLEAPEGIKLSSDKIGIIAKEMIFQQRGFGEISWETDGKMRILSKIEGNRGDVMQIQSESNTHEKSIHIYSRIGGIYLEGQTIGLDGKIQINGVEIIGGDSRLSIGGMMEVSGLKIGKNMFIEPKGISLLQKEEIEFRNMDLKIGGRLDVESLRVKKILGGAEVEGKMRVIGGIDCKGGIVGDGYRLGNWDAGNRSCLKIDMKGTVWNEGVNIAGGGRSIVVDGDIVCGGEGRILAHCPREGRQDIGKLLEEVAAMGESGSWDVGRALQKLAAIVGILAAEKEE
jgi:hypothetical protein